LVEVSSKLTQAKIEYREKKSRSRTKRLSGPWHHLGFDRESTIAR